MLWCAEILRLFDVITMHTTTDGSLWQHCAIWHTGKCCQLHLKSTVLKSEDFTKSQWVTSRAWWWL